MIHILVFLVFCSTPYDRLGGGRVCLPPQQVQSLSVCHALAAALRSSSYGYGTPICVSVRP